LPGCDALIIEDYDKGLLSPGLISEAISSANKLRFGDGGSQLRHFFHYRDGISSSPITQNYNVVWEKALKTTSSFCRPRPRPVKT
jgi:hypothetical protein